MNWKSERELERLLGRRRLVARKESAIWMFWRQVGCTAERYTCIQNEEEIKLRTKGTILEAV